MSDSASKPFLPSKSRVALAAQKGLVLQSPILICGAVLIATGVTSLGMHHHVKLLSLPVFNVATGQADIATFMTAQLQRLFFHALLLALPLFALLTAAVILVRRQKKGGQSAVPIPPGLPTFRDDLVAATLTLTTAAFVIIAIVRGSGFTYAELANAPGSALVRLVTVFLWCCIATGAVAVMGGIIQLTLRRSRLIRHLSLSRSETDKEQRLQGQHAVRHRLRERKTVD